MEFLLFISLVSCAYGLKFQNTEYGVPFVAEPLTSTSIIGGDEDLTVTVYATHDTYKTITDKFYNTVPVIISEFRKSTVTLPTREVVRTPVDDVVRIQTQLVTQFPSTEFVTDVISRHICATETSTDFFTVTHFDQRYLQKTITSVVVQTITFRPTIVRTVLSTERELFTETEFVTKTIYDSPQGHRTHEHIRSYF